MDAARLAPFRKKSWINGRWTVSRQSSVATWWRVKRCESRDRVMWSQEGDGEDVLDVAGGCVRGHSWKSETRKWSNTTLNGSSSRGADGQAVAALSCDRGALHFENGASDQSGKALRVVWRFEYRTWRERWKRVSEALEEWLGSSAEDWPNGTFLPGRLCPQSCVRLSQTSSGRIVAPLLQTTTNTDLVISFFALYSLTCPALADPVVPALQLVALPPLRPRAREVRTPWPLPSSTTRHRLRPTRSSLPPCSSSAAPVFSARWLPPPLVSPSAPPSATVSPTCSSVALAPPRLSRRSSPLPRLTTRVPTLRSSRTSAQAANRRARTSSSASRAVSLNHHLQSAYLA